MKKLILFLGIIFSSNAFAGTISIAPFISGNDVTIAALETQRTTISNVINGNIDGASNILAGSLISQDFATSVSLIKFRDEAFNDFTFSGMLPVTSASLSSNISSGVSYVNGVRIETNSTSHTYTASKDTYVYINAGGFFDFSEVANGTSAPTTPANDLLLAKVVSSGTALTSVTDMRTTSIQITSNGSNFASDYRDQAYLIRDSTTAVHFEPGQIAIGSSYYTNLSDTSSLSTATAANWIEGSVPNLNALKFYTYAFNNSGTTWNFKYASADPVNSDSNSGVNGTLRYYVTGGTTYRALGWISTDGSGLIQTNAFGDTADGNIVNQVSTITGAVATGTNTIADSDTLPVQTSGDQYMQCIIRPTNINNTLRINVTAWTACSAGSKTTTALFQDSTSNALAVGNNLINAPSNMTSGTTFTYIMKAGTTSPITFKVRCGGTAGTLTFNGQSGARIYGGVFSSSIIIQEIEG